MQITAIRSIVLTTCLISVAAFAGAPAEMTISNKTDFVSNAYIHAKPSPYVLAPYSSEQIPWAAVTAACHNTALGVVDPCAFEVYASKDNTNAKAVDVGTVTFYLNSGDIVSVVNNPNRWNLAIVSDDNKASFSLVKQH